jgi:hypothetical protein
MNIEVKPEESQNIENDHNTNPHLTEAKSLEKNPKTNSNQNIFDSNLANNSTPQKNSEKKANLNSAKNENIKIEDFFVSNADLEDQVFKGIINK